MKQAVLTLGLLLVALPLAAQTQDVKLLADTLTVQAEARHEAEPDLATLHFQISAQEKQFQRAYEQATRSMQRVLQLAERHGLSKQDISTGALTVLPIYEWGDKKPRPRAYRVEGTVALRIRDFARIGPLVDDAVQAGIAELRSLTYSLADEEAAKQRAVAEAMRQAEGRARAALGDNRRLGALRYASVDVKQVTGIVRLEALQEAAQVAELHSGLRARTDKFPALPPQTPEKITVSASVQCVFQIQ